MIALVFLVMAVSTAAWAHDESAHKGKATPGTVAAVSSDKLTLDTENGTLAVVLTTATKVELSEKPVGREALSVGEHVTVFGTTVPGEGLVAREIVIRNDAKGHAH